MTPKRRRPWAGFAIFAVLAILALFVLDGPAAGIASLAALLAFIFACMYALRRQDPDSVSHNERTGLSGWFGGWL